MNSISVEVGDMFRYHDLDGFYGVAVITKTKHLEAEVTWIYSAKDNRDFAFNANVFSYKFFSEREYWSKLA